LWSNTCVVHYLDAQLEVYTLRVAAIGTSWARFERGYTTGGAFPISGLVQDTHDEFEAGCRRSKLDLLLVEAIYNISMITRCMRMSEV